MTVLQQADSMRDEKGNSTVEAHLSNWQKEKTILMDRSVAFGSSRFSQTFRIHRSLLIYDSGYCTPNSAIGECSWRRRARKTAKFAPYFTCLFLVPLIMDATPLANMQTFPPSNARGRRGQVYQPITAQTADLQLCDWTVFHLYLILFLSFVLKNYNTTSSFLGSLQILPPCPCWHSYDAELCFHWHKLQLSHSWISYEKLDSDNYFFAGYHLQPRSVSLF